MNVVIPPLVIYAFGVILVLAGALRAWMFGRRHPNVEVADDDPARARLRRRHLRLGVLWMLMGLFLIFSTATTLKTRAAPASRVLHVDRVEGPTGGAATIGPPPGPPAPTLRLEPAPTTTAPPPEKP